MKSWDLSMGSDAIRPIRVNQSKLPPSAAQKPSLKR